MFHRPIDPVPAGLHNLFFAVRPPPDICRRMAELTTSFPTGGRPMRRDRLHVTLLQLVCGNLLPPGLAAAAADVAGSLRAPPFTVMFDRLVAGEKSTLLMPSEPLPALCALRERLGLLLRQAGLDVRIDGRFSPHVTLLYGNTRKFVTQDEPIIWTVENFVLIDSHVGRTRHEEVGRWRLAG